MSLETRRYLEAEHLAVVLDTAFAKAVHIFGMFSRTAEPPSVADVVKLYLRDELEKHMMFRANIPGRGDPIAAWPLRLLKETLEMLKGQLDRRDIHEHRSEIDELLSRHGLPEVDRRAVGIGVLESHVTLYSEAIRRARGEVSMFGAVQQAPVPLDTAATARPATPPPASTKPKASELIEPFFRRRATINGTREQVMAQERATLRRFIEAFGEKPIDTYRRADVTAFLGIMRRLPTTYGRSPKGKEVTLADLIELLPVWWAPSLGVLMRTESADGTTIVLAASSSWRLFGWCMALGCLWCRPLVTWTLARTCCVAGSRN